MLLDLTLQGKLINLIESFALVIAIWSVSGHSPFILIRLFSLQSLLLALGTALIAHVTGFHHVYFAAGFTFLFKVILIPVVLTYLAKKIEHRSDKDYLNAATSLIVAAFFTMVAFMTSLRLITKSGAFSSPWVLAIAISVMLIGLFIMVNRRNILSQIIGLMFMENGVFLAAIAVTYGMPLLIEFGIFFDVFVAILIMTTLLFKIHASEKGIQMGKST